MAVALVGASVADFTGVGHTVALLQGMALSLRLGSAAPWTPARVVSMSAAATEGVCAGLDCPRCYEADLMPRSGGASCCGVEEFALIEQVMQRLAGLHLAPCPVPGAGNARSDCH